MPVTNLHDTYESAMEEARFVSDACAGGKRVKNEQYIPQFSPADVARYQQMILRTYYTNFTGRTKNAMSGAIFRKPFKRREIPQAISMLADNADGEGNSIEQVAKRAVDNVLKRGNYGILADYPRGIENPSLEQVRELGLRPYMKTYTKENIINFDTRIINGVSVPCLVVLREVVRDYTDMYSWSNKYQYRTLYLDENNVYFQSLTDEDGTLIEEDTAPLQNGSVMNHIPFQFIGANDNQYGYDRPPLYDLAEVNYAHLRNTAIREEELFKVGQRMFTVDIGEMDATDWERANPNGIHVGSNRAIITKKGGADVVGADDTGALSKAIEEKENQAVMIGAKLITANAINETAETARINASSETSVLNTIVGNVSEALEGAMEDCARFAGVDIPDSGEKVIEIRLNDSFYDEEPTKEDIEAILLLRESEIMSKAEALHYLKRKGLDLGEKSVEDILDEAGDDPAGLTDMGSDDE